VQKLEMKSKNEHNTQRIKKMKEKFLKRPKGEGERERE